uniref:Protein disulfide-isomerase n=1 Tax=Plectus sambesii TaxID=2011161 RepID=A0A914WED8_9BILA
MASVTFRAQRFKPRALAKTFGDSPDDKGHTTRRLGKRQLFAEPVEVVVVPPSAGRVTRVVWSKEETIAMVPRVLAVVFLAAVVLAGDGVEWEMDEGVAILTEKNFDGFLEMHPTALIEFYAPWCGHCKKLGPEYEKAAKALADKSPAVPLAKVDTTIEAELGKRYDIKGYPTLKFWKDGTPTEYDGPREADGIIDWVAQRTDPNYKPEPEAVKTLTVENFDEFVAANELVLVEFYAPWCGHCKQLAPEFEKAAKKLLAQPKPIALGKVDATVERSLGDKFGVSGYPTLKILRNGKRFDYNGPRDAAGIVTYMMEQSKPAARKLDSVKDAQRMMSKDDVTIIGFFATDDSKLFENFADAAESTREEFTAVGYTLDPEVIKHFKAKINDVILFFPERYWSKSQPKTKIFNKPSTTQEEMLSFWRDNATPLVGHRTQANIKTRYSKFPLVVVYYSVDFSVQHREGTQYWRNKVLELAQPYMEKFRFAISDEEEFAKELEEVGLGDSGLEHNVLVFGYDGKKYPMDPKQYDGDFDENFPEFMKKISEAKIKAYVKSAPAPKDDKSPLRTLVGSTFAKVALDESKDVLVEFYAPWCGHCKAFEPKYKQLAAKLQAEQPNLILAKYDATANDAPENFNVEGFPTIYFAPSGKKETPIKYNGNRDLDDLTKFMKQHAVKSFQDAKNKKVDEKKADGKKADDKKADEKKPGEQKKKKSDEL